MKKLYLHTLLVLVSGLLAFTACTTDETNDVNPAVQSETVDIAVLVGDKGVDTSRTYVDEANNKVCWNASGEVLKVFYVADFPENTYPTAVNTNSFELNPDTGGARFTVSVTPQTGKKSYTFSAIYPTNENYAYDLGNVTMTVPTTQVPVEGSFDPKADLMMASAPVTSETVPEQIKFDLKRVVALSKMTLARLDPGQKVTRVKITATAPEGSAQPYISGTVKAHLTEYTDTYGTGETYPAGSVTYCGPEYSYYDGTPYKTITLDLSGYDCIADDKGEVTVWFTSMPVVLTGCSLYVEAVTAEWKYSRTVDLTGKNLELKVNAINSFGVNLTDKAEGFKGYSLVTSLDKLQEGAQIVLCDKETQPTSPYQKPHLLSTTAETQTSNNYFGKDYSIGYAFADTKISDDGISLEDATNAKVFTVIKNGDQYALKASDGYLYASNRTEGYDKYFELGVQNDPVYWNATLKESYGTHPIALYTSSLYLSAVYNFSCSTSNGGNIFIFQKVGGGSEPEQPATPTYELNLKSVSYSFDRMANLTLFENETPGDGNLINLGLMNPDMTDARLLAGEYPLAADDSYIGETPATMGGGISYNGAAYTIVSADHITLTTDDANPNWLKVSFKVTAMDENGAEAIFTGEWAGEMDYAQPIDLSNAFASATNVILGYDDQGNQTGAPLFGVTLTGYAENTSVEFEMFNYTLYTSATPILTSAFTEYYPYVDPSVSPVMGDEGVGCFTQNARIVYNGQTYELEYCDDSDLEFTNPKTWIKVLVTETETTIDFKLRSKDGLYVFTGSWTGTLDHTGTTPEQGGML